MTTQSYPPLALLIDGTWVAGGGRETRPVANPASAETFAELPIATLADIDAAGEAAARAFRSWRRVPAIERASLLLSIARLVRRDEARLSAILTREQGKRLPEALQEVRGSADTFEWMAEEGKRAYGRIVPARTPDTDQLVYVEPVGPVAAFSPWNFPAVLGARKVATALAAGCTVVLKPAEETPGIWVALAALCVEAGLPPGVLNLVYGVPAEVSSRLIANPRIRKISFTGSVAVGRHLAVQAAAVSKRATLELGGHAPVIVTGDVDVDRVVELTAAAKFRNAGQLCLCPTRFYVHDDVHDRFVARLGARAAALRVGDGADPATDMGPLASSRRVEAMRAFCADAVDRGGRVVSGGKVPAGRDAGWFWAPTVIADVPDDARAMVEEPFGPLALVSRYSRLDDAIERANSTEYGLAAYAFTRSLNDARAIEHGVEAGNVSINTFAVSAPEMPFSGVKSSGPGSEMGREGLLDHLHPKAVVRALA
ncbi:NAD-dependent succinate-semialdehyde dehydrogenase [Piscinibacter koreensis]|uniref:NAD-dependent succinate-semialdehyde dehydrogenase n=1 Tax=Piscinibacter koreensis TaxID=2742824 RepID=A0A7Y6NQX7_9BURK|nr:NAD-dependent succinate-semialdehyde dehydrogenase [Schlegelella koreensis]NUZ07707.1 NAD-dependent succinate-semialdehyde dehydrogenase [Schlegelella koreensis]